MLKIKKLQVLGFKSFCDRTELVFPGSGIVGIVGPNGCGKSNLADAVSWVLGEQSAKSLRGQRMEDVIFAGSRDRAATGLAEVSLTLVNPEDYSGPEDEPPLIQVHDDWDEASSQTAQAAAAQGEELAEGDSEEMEEVLAAPAGAEAGQGSEGQAAANGNGVVLTIRKRRKFIANNRPGEIVVTRRLYRSGESEYLMNGRPCRLRDIQDLFMGTGLGPDSYAIIEQGRIGQILSSKPHDRRAIIEEAAGVTKYKAKKKLAEARLESARQNLNRINDIFEEVTKQVASLKRQAAKAQRYAELKAESDQHLRRLFASKADALQEQHTRVSAEHEQDRAALEAAQTGLDQAEATRAEWFQRASQVEQELRQLTEDSGKLAMELDRAERQIVFNSEQARELENRTRGFEEELSRLAEQRAAAQQELKSAEEARTAVLAEAQAARAAYQEQRAAGENESRAARELEQKADQARRRVLGLLGQISSFGNQVVQAETVIANLERQLARLDQEKQTADQELDALGVRRGQLDLEFQGQREELEQVVQEIGKLERRVSELRQNEAVSRKQLDAARAELSEIVGRRRSIEQIVAHHGYSTEAVKKLFASGAAKDKFHAMGVLADFLEVEGSYEAVVEEFLRDELNYVVVHDWNDAQSGLGVLQTDVQGRATFLVHPQDGQYKMFDLPQHLESQGIPESPNPIPLKSCVRVLNGFGKSLEHLLPKLGSGYIVPDPAVARQMATQNPQAFFLTAGGECFHNHTVSGGTHSGAGPLTLKRELRELGRREGEVSETIQRIETQLSGIAQELQVTQHDLDRLRARRHELDKQILTSGQGLKQLENEVRRLQERLRLHTVELERGRAERTQGMNRLESLQAQRQQAEQDKAAAEAEEIQINADIAEVRLRRDQAVQRVAEAQSRLAMLEERSRGAQEAFQRLEHQQRDLLNRSNQIHSDLERANQQREQLLSSSGELGEKVQQLRLRRDEAEQQRQALEQERVEARARAAELEAGVKAARDAVNALRDRFSELEVALARLQADAEHVTETCRNELNIEITELQADETIVRAAAEEMADLEQAARAIRTKIEHLGPVNMMALEEYQETQTRHQFLETQRKDLLDSIADTQKAIQEIDQISRQQFNEAFEKINAYFQESFKVLFGGGQGFLKLTDAENDPESGVDIVAQPPGKKLQNALLLSGGEKAMTAMALLLSVFQYQPSPFCVLDEVDAPLDEANVSRFSAMVRKMSEQTQFIIITHNKRTMEIAPLLYGVTMQQAGVSRLVSVNMEGKSERASA